MGAWVSTFWDRLFATQQEMRLVIVGLDAAGKTTIMFKMQLDEYVKVAPTVGFNTEDVKIKNVNIKVFDLSGQVKMRKVWSYYYSNIEGIIFVVDASHTERIHEAREELHNLLSNQEALNLPLLIFGNKQDLPEALRMDQLCEQLGIEEILKKTHQIAVMESSAVQDIGLAEGFEWIADRMVENAKMRS